MQLSIFLIGNILSQIKDNIIFNIKNNNTSKNNKNKNTNTNTNSKNNINSNNKYGYDQLPQLTKLERLHYRLLNVFENGRGIENVRDEQIYFELLLHFLQEIQNINDGEVEGHIQEITAASVMLKIGHWILEYALKHNCTQLVVTIATIDILNFANEETVKRHYFKTQQNKSKSKRKIVSNLKTMQMIICTNYTANK